MFIKLAHFLNIMLFALVAGVMWGTWLSLGRTMTEYDAPTFLADGKHMIANLATVMPVLMIATGVLSLVVVILLSVAARPRRPGWPSPDRWRSWGSSP
jgi:drug/metabolite transporter (DMT)-like permease